MGFQNDFLIKIGGGNRNSNNSTICWEMEWIVPQLQLFCKMKCAN